MIISFGFSISTRFDGDASNNMQAGDNLFSGDDAQSSLLQEGSLLDNLVISVRALTQYDIYLKEEHDALADDHDALAADVRDLKRRLQELDQTLELIHFQT